LPLLVATPAFLPGPGRFALSWCVAAAGLSGLPRLPSVPLALAPAPSCPPAFLASVAGLFGCVTGRGLGCGFGFSACLPITGFFGAGSVGFWVTSTLMIFGGFFGSGGFGSSFGT